MRLLCRPPFLFRPDLPFTVTVTVLRKTNQRLLFNCKKYHTGYLYQFCIAAINPQVPPGNNPSVLLYLTGYVAMYGSLHLCSHSSSTPCIHRHRLQRCREVPRRPSAAAAATAPRVGQSLDQSAFETVTSIVQQHGLDKDASLVAQEAGLAFNYLQAAGCLPSSLQEATQLVQHALELSDLLATGSTFRTLQMVKRHPDLLSIPPDEVGRCLLVNSRASLCFRRRLACLSAITACSTPVKLIRSFQHGQLAF